MTGNCQLLGRLPGVRRTVVSDNDSAVAVAGNHGQHSAKRFPSVLFTEKSLGGRSLCTHFKDLEDEAQRC